MPTPIWTEHQAMPDFPALKHDLTVDAAVIGGGLTGLTTAYLLRKAGLSVVVLEKGSLGQGEISHTTAHLTYVTDPRLSELVDDLGEEDAQAFWEAGRASLDQIERISDELEIDCDFKRVPGYLHAPWKSADDDRAGLQRDATLARKLGFAADFVEAVPFVSRPGILFHNQARFQPFAYLAGLAQALKAAGGHIFQETEVDEITDDLEVKLGKYRVKAGFVVLATHVPLMGKAGMLQAALFQTKIAPYSTYALGAEMPHGVVPEGLYWDTSDPYYYLRVDRHGEEDLVVFGGEDHKTGQIDDTRKPYARLEELLHTILPQAKITNRWSGQVIETIDGLPYIGEETKGQFIATGFCGNGITLGTAAAMMAVDSVHGRKSAWHDLFDPSRKALKHSWDYVTENKDFPYYMVKDRLTPAEDGAAADLLPGEGKILSINGEKAAVSCDADGRICAVSAVCTHMGCLVHWNQAEQTWDCPCHGSRFSAEGEVIGGPAETKLAPCDIHEKAK